MVFRHPFPGPGLGVRILGDVTRERAELLRRADAIFIEELRAATNEDGITWYDQVAQAFAVFLPVRSVGVMGDGRTYDFVVALRAVTTTDFMTATWAELPYALPGVVLAISAILVFLKPLPIVHASLYNTVWIILFCYLARFLALGLRPVVSGYHQLDRTLEEASQIAGARLLRRIRTIILPRNCWSGPTRRLPGWASRTWRTGLWRTCPREKRNAH